MASHATWVQQVYALIETPVFDRGSIILIHNLEGITQEVTLKTKTYLHYIICEFLNCMLQTPCRMVSAAYSSRYMYM